MTSFRSGPTFSTSFSSSRVLPISAIPRSLEHSRLAFSTFSTVWMRKIRRDQSGVNKKWALLYICFPESLLFSVFGVVFGSIHFIILDNQLNYSVSWTNRRLSPMQWGRMLIWIGCRTSLLLRTPLPMSIVSFSFLPIWTKHRFIPVKDIPYLEEVTFGKIVTR